MATRALFNHTSVQSEQNLVESLIIEAIQIYGFDVYYLPKKTQNLDSFYGEDIGTTHYTEAYPVEMYVKNVEGFEGEGDFLSQFGLQIRDQVTFTIARKRFEELGTGLNQPAEGDLVYFPLTGSMYTIQFSENESIFYQMGELFVYDLQCELFEFADEVFDTGVTDIDEYWLGIADGTTYELIPGSGTYIPGEVVYQGPTLSGATMRAYVQNFTTSGTTEISLVNQTATPADGAALIGVESGAQLVVNLPSADVEQTEMEGAGTGTNWDIEQEADEFIDFSEKTPFGDF